jgi:hypothetical protein
VPSSRAPSRALTGLLVAAGVTLVALGAAVAVALLLPPSGKVDRLACSYWDRGYCHEVTGRVVVSENVDSDKDGDLHLVLLSKQSISGPGVSIIKVPREMRPAHVPGFGTWITAVGFTFQGQRGKQELQVRQMHAR